MHARTRARASQRLTYITNAYPSGKKGAAAAEEGGAVPLASERCSPALEDDEEPEEEPEEEEPEEEEAPEAPGRLVRTRLCWWPAKVKGAKAYPSAWKNLF